MSSMSEEHRSASMPEKEVTAGSSEEKKSSSPGSSKRSDPHTLKDERAARRRRILARGSDRLAYITGEKSGLLKGDVDSLVSAPTSVPSASTFELPTRDSFGTFSPGISGDISSQKSGSQFGTNSVINRGVGDVRELQEDATRMSLADYFSSMQEVTTASHNQSPSSLPNIFLSSETFPASYPQASNSMQEQLSHTFQSSMPQDSSYSRGNQNKKTSLQKLAEHLCVPAIDAAVDKTQNLRIISALLLALLALAQIVFTVCDWPGVSTLHFFMLPYPVYPVILLLLTDMTLVAGRLMLGLQRKDSQKLKGETGSHATSINSESGSTDILRGPSRSGSGLLSNLLEEDDTAAQGLESFLGKLQQTMGRGMLVLKISRGLSLDVSVFVVALCCGKSIIDMLGSHCVLQ